MLFVYLVELISRNLLVRLPQENNNTYYFTFHSKSMKWVMYSTHRFRFLLGKQEDKLGVIPKMATMKDLGKESPTHAFLSVVWCFRSLWHSGSCFNMASPVCVACQPLLSHHHLKYIFVPLIQCVHNMIEREVVWYYWACWTHVGKRILNCPCGYCFNLFQSSQMYKAANHKGVFMFHFFAYDPDFQ